MFGSRINGESIWLGPSTDLSQNTLIAENLHVDSCDGRYEINNGNGVNAQYAMVFEDDDNNT